MTDLEWLRSLANWAGERPVILFLIVSASAVFGMVISATIAAAHDGDTEADRLIRERVKANREKRAARVHCNCVESDDEHAEHLGAA